MAIAHQFEYVKPGTLREAVKTLARYGSRAQILAGGTDLVGLIADDKLAPEAVVDIKGIAGLDKIEFKNGILTIGALVTFNDLRDSAIIAKKFPVIREMTGWVASVGIRNRATMIGNICSAVPCCDSGPVLLVYDASVLVTGPSGKRKVALRDWFLGPRKTVLKRGEIATAVAVTLPKKKHGACFVKLRRYEGEDLAQASVTVLALAEQQLPDILRLRRAASDSRGKDRISPRGPVTNGSIDSAGGAACPAGNRPHHGHPRHQGVPHAHDGRDAGARFARRGRAPGGRWPCLRHKLDLGSGP